MASFRQIPKTASSPANPGAPSFLTNLPGEVRNAVYKVLFERDGTVLLHNADAYHAKEPVRAAGQDTELFIADLNGFDAIYEEEIGSDADFRHGFHIALPLLRSCRQIYHESASIFYGSNKFVISRALNRHDSDHDGYHKGHNEYSQFKFAPQWLSQLGSQSLYLRNVVIDVGATCPDTCDDEWPWIDMLPLARFLWYHTSEKCSLSFADTARRLSVHEDVDQSDPAEAIDANSCNSILFELAARDALKIKRFGRSSRLLESIEVSPRYLAGTIHYKASSGNYSHIENVLISDRGRKLQIADVAPDGCCLLRLSLDLLQDIVALVTSSSSSSSASGNVVFDLDSRTAHGLPLNILQVCHQIRHSYLAPLAIAMANSITLLMTTHTAITDFEHFGALKGMLPYAGHDEYHLMPIRQIIGWSSHEANLKIALQVRLRKHTILEEVRIDIKELADMIRYSTLGQSVTIRITLLSCTSDGVHEETATISFGDLQKRLFLLLSDVLTTWPDWLPLKVSKETPSIWINGRGSIIEASYPASTGYPGFTVPNRHSQLRIAEVIMRGYQMSHDVPLSASIGPMRDAWHWLRRLYWKDHVTRRPN